jgi:hypothetical protein
MTLMKQRGPVSAWYHTWLKRRPGALYEFEVVHPDTVFLPSEDRRVVPGYGGKTRQNPDKRLKEHCYGSRYGGKVQPPKPWIDTVVRFRVVRQWDSVTGWWLGWREYRLIRRRRYLYNVDYNLDNPQRVTKQQKVDQRMARDAARDSGRWVYSYQPPVFPSPALARRGAEMGVRRTRSGKVERYGSALSPQRRPVSRVKW